MANDDEVRKGLDTIHQGLDRWLDLFHGAEFSYFGVSRDNAPVRLVTARLTFCIEQPNREHELVSGPYRFGVVPCLRSMAGRVLATAVSDVLETALTGTIELKGRAHRILGPLQLGQRINACRWQRRPSFVRDREWPSDCLHLSSDQSIRELSTDLEWDELEGALLSGGVTGLQPMRGIAGLCDLLGLPRDLRRADNASMVIVVPLCFGLSAVSVNSSDIRITVTAPEMARTEDMILTVFTEGGELTLREPPASQAWAKDAASIGLVRYSRTCSENGRVKRFCHLVYGSSPVADCAFAYPSHSEHLYGILDQRAEALERVLDSAARGPEHESACGALMSVLGFSVIPTSHLGEAGDWLAMGISTEETAAAESPFGAGKAVACGGGEWFLVECSLACKDKGRVRQLAKLARVLAERSGLSVKPVLMIQLRRIDLPAVVIATCEAEGVSVVCKEEFVNLLRLARTPEDPNRLREAIGMLGGDSAAGVPSLFMMSHDDR